MGLRGRAHAFRREFRATSHAAADPAGRTPSMIVGIGLDIVEVARWSRVLAKIEAQVFTPRELAACAGRVDREDALAARFAAKAACLKALRAGIRQGALRQCTLVSAPRGAPGTPCVAE